jgi:hypothetical protein
MRQINVRFTLEEYEQIKRQAEAEHRSMASLLKYMIMQSLEERKEQEVGV